MTRKAWHDRASPAERGYGAEWRKLAAMVARRDRWTCQHCRAIGVRGEVDHRTPKAQGGTDDPDNLQFLCRPCHDVKTATENGRTLRFGSCDINGLPTDDRHPWNVQARHAQATADEVEP